MRLDESWNVFRSPRQLYLALWVFLCTIEYALDIKKKRMLLNVKTTVKKNARSILRNKVFMNAGLLYVYIAWTSTLSCIIYVNLVKELCFKKRSFDI